MRHTDLEIVTVFDAELRGICNYYHLASNYRNLNYFSYLMEYSCLKTLSGKHRCKLSKIYDKYRIGEKRWGIPYETKAGKKIRRLTKFNEIDGKKCEDIEPAILSSSLSVFDDGSISTDIVPTAPGCITVPENVQGGTSLEVTWGASTDPDDDPIGYELERQVDNGEWEQVYKGEATSYTDAITRGWLTVAYRVRAYDSYGATSDYPQWGQTRNRSVPPECHCRPRPVP